MVINKTNISARKTNFLDLTISIYRGKFLVKLYDKRNDYNFDVINYPFLDGNIPKGQSYGIFISQLVRLARINSSFNSFIVDCKNLVRKLEGQSFIILLPCANDLKSLSTSILIFGENLGLI